jgi:hypothetical protein
MWHWIRGTSTPETVYGLSGGLNSISTTCLTYPGQELGIVLLLNTRLDQLSNISAYDIARGIGNIVLDFPKQVLSSSVLYKPWIILDGAIVLFVTAIVWQAFRLKGWRNRYQSSRVSTKVWAWVGIVSNLILCAAILYLPTLLGSRWNIILFMRPDIAIPLLMIAALFGSLGLYKAVRNFV